jgi:hypothetical protein
LFLKKCSECNVEKPFSEFYNSKKSKDKKGSRCKRCSLTYSVQWKRNNKERSDNTNYIYNTSEIGFITNSISSTFNNKRGNIPNITKLEIFEELLLHIERKKQEFPESNGRLCDYCNESWVYKRKPPNVIKTNNKKNIYNFSIDRLDNNITYQKGNIIFCHHKCNDIKHSITIEMCERILKLHKMKKENNEVE